MILPNVLYIGIHFLKNPQRKTRYLQTNHMSLYWVRIIKPKPSKKNTYRLWSQIGLVQMPPLPHTLMWVKIMVTTSRVCCENTGHKVWESGQ